MIALNSHFAARFLSLSPLCNLQVSVMLGHLKGTTWAGNNEVKSMRSWLGMRMIQLWKAENTLKMSFYFYWKVSYYFCASTADAAVTALLTRAWHNIFSSLTEYTLGYCDALHPRIIYLSEWLLSLKLLLATPKLYQLFCRLAGQAYAKPICWHNGTRGRACAVFSRVHMNV